VSTASVHTSTSTGITLVPQQQCSSAAVQQCSSAAVQQYSPTHLIMRTFTKPASLSIRRYSEGGTHPVTQSEEGTAAVSMVLIVFSVACFS
jgi:hypothetical protein